MSRESVAHHEAGHAVASWLLTGTTGGLSLTRDEWSHGRASVRQLVGRAELTDGWWTAVSGEWIDSDLRDRVEREAVISLAGAATALVAAERGQAPEPPPKLDPADPAHRPGYIAALNSGVPRFESDQEHVERCLEQLCASPDERTAYRVLLEQRTWTFVRRNARFWPLVEALARELLIRDELSGGDVAAIIATVEGDDTDVPQALIA